MLQVPCIRTMIIRISFLKIFATEGLYKHAFMMELSMVQKLLDPSSIEYQTKSGPRMILPIMISASHL